jgi:hypothetical protein
VAALRIEPLGSEVALYAHRCMQISENFQKAKFAELLFHALQ